MYTHLQGGQNLIESIKSKAAYEQIAATFGIRVKNFYTDNRIFAEKRLKSDGSNNDETMSYCGVEAHFQNGIAEASIKQLTEKASKFWSMQSIDGQRLYNLAFGPLR